MVSRFARIPISQQVWVTGKEPEPFARANSTATQRRHRHEACGLLRPRDVVPCKKGDPRCRIQHFFTPKWGIPKAVGFKTNIVTFWTL